MQTVVLVRHLVAGFFLLLLFASCDSSKRDAATIVDEPATVVRGVLATTDYRATTRIPALITVTQNIVKPTQAQTAVPTTPATIPPVTRTALPVASPSAGFSGLRFALTADGAPHSEFPAGTDEVFAVWEYVGMSPTDNIRRIWFRDDQIWLTREEGWNWGEHDSEGTVRHISVYDDEGSGLTSATYRLQLYVNDELHGDATFVVTAP